MIGTTPADIHLLRESPRRAAADACVEDACSASIACITVRGWRMATLTIRDLDDEVKARLRIRAAENGRSMEAEARVLLAAALRDRRPARGLGSYIRDQFAEIGGAELDIPARKDPPRVAEIDS